VRIDADDHSILSSSAVLAGRRGESSCITASSTSPSASWPDEAFNRCVLGGIGSLPGALLGGLVRDWSNRLVGYADAAYKMSRIRDPGSGPDLRPADCSDGRDRESLTMPSTFRPRLRDAAFAAAVAVFSCCRRRLQLVDFPAARDNTRWQCLPRLSD